MKLKGKFVVNLYCKFYEVIFIHNLDMTQQKTPLIMIAVELHTQMKLALFILMLLNIRREIWQMELDLLLLDVQEFHFLMKFH